MAAKTYAGMFGSGNWDIPANRPTTWFEKAFELWPDNHLSLIYLMSKLKKRAVTDWEFNLHEFRHQPMAYDFASSSNGTGPIDHVDLVFSGTEPIVGVHAGDLLINETTEEIILVANDPVAPFTTLAGVVRHHGGTALTSPVTAGDVFRWNGNAFGEGANAPASSQTQTTTRTQYLQNMMETADVTEQSKHIESRPYGSMESSQKQALFRLMTKAEASMFHGAKTKGVDSRGQPVYTMDGLDHMVTTNVVDFTGGMTLNGLEDAAEMGMREGSPTKTLVCGYTAYNVICRAISRNTTGNWSLGSRAPKDVSYGLTVRRIETPSGDMDLVRSKHLGQSALYTQRAYLLDPENLMYCYLEGMDVTWHPNEGPPAAQRDVGYYDGMVSIGLALEETHAIWTGISTYKE